MKTKLALTLALAVALPAVHLLGQNQPPQGGGQRPQPGGAGGQGGPGGPGGGMGQRPMSPLMEVLDANKDGVLDATEIANASVALKKLDKNGDGKLTQDEMRPQRPGGQGGPGGPGGGGQGGQGGPGGNGGGRPQSNSSGAPISLPEDHGRPVGLVAAELGVTPEQFRAAFKNVTPARPGETPTQAQRQANRTALSTTLGVSPERLDEVMDKYRPGGAEEGRRVRQEPEAGAPH